MGKPAARQGDGTLKGGPITQGSLTVLIGSSGGVACSACPGGVAEGNPVNPMLGAKVLGGETDLRLPAAIPFVLSRDYSSYQTPTPAAVGLLGPGWWLAGEPSVQAGPQQWVLNDTKGRSLRFDPLEPGEVAYSHSEHLWLVRGGQAQLQGAGHARRVAPAWESLPEALRLDAGYVLATADPLGPWWVLGPRSDTGLHPLRALADIHGRRQEYLRHTEGEYRGHIHMVIDSAGRRYEYELQRIRAEGPPAHGWGADSGVRLVAVHLRHDPAGGAGDLPARPLVRYTYTRAGELGAVYGRDGRQQRQFEYDPQHPGRMTGHAYAARPMSRYRYDAQGRVAEQTNPGGLDYRFDYSPSADPGAPDRRLQASTLVTDSLGRERRYLFEGEAGLQRVAAVIEADGSITRRRYDAAGRLLQSTDALGRQTTYTLDAATGDVVGVTDPAGRSTRLEYNPQGQITRSASPGGSGTNTQHWRYDALGRLLQHTDALGHSTHYHYGGAGSDRPEAITDAKGGRKHLQWDGQGQLTRYTDCSGRHTDYRYDRWGQLIQVRGEEGRQQSQEHDEGGRLIASTNALQETTRYGYSAAGDLERIQYPDGTHIQLGHDAWGRLTRYQYGRDGHTQSQHYRVDAAGRLTELHNENASVYHLRYDSQDRLVEETGFDGVQHSYAYNAVGDLVRSRDALHQIDYHYDAQSGQLQARSIRARGSDGSSDAAPVVEAYEYDGAGQLTSASHQVWDGYAIAVQMERDALGRVLEETQSVRTPQGEPLWSHSTRHRYDELGHIVQDDIPGLPPLHWHTYGSGHLHGVVLGEQTLLDIERDALHRETQRRFGASQTQRSYDRLSRLSGVQLSRLAGSAAPTDDAPTAGGPPGQPRLLGQHNRSYQYNRLGQLTRIGTQAGPLDYRYDALGRLTEAHRPGQPAQHYAFDPAGNRLFERSPGNTGHPPANGDEWAAQVRSQLHDPAFDLLQAPGQDGAQGGQPRWPTNRILEDGRYRYRYDALGNLTEKTGQGEHHRYQWDHASRLIAYSRSQAADTGAAATHTSSYHFYDVFGRRLASKTVPAAPGEHARQALMRLYGWDGDRLTLTERRQQQDGQVPQITRIHTVYEPGGFVPMLRIETAAKAPERSLAGLLQEHTGQPMGPQEREMLEAVEREIRAGEAPQMRHMLQPYGVDADALRASLDTPLPAITGIHQYHCDYLGTPLALIDLQGRIEWQATLDAWGNLIGEDNPGRLYQPIRMQGQHWDEESGLHYNRYRYYDPKLGRYISQDPIGLSGGENLSLYTKNSPVNYFDPLGLKYPSDHPHCKAIQKKMDNIKEQLDKRWDDLAKNPGKLPERLGPSEALQDTVRGHRVLINKEDSVLRKWESQYDKDCEKDDDGRGGPSLGECVGIGLAAVVVGVAVVLAPEVAIPAMIFGGAAAQ